MDGNPKGPSPVGRPRKAAMSAKSNNQYESPTDEASTSQSASSGPNNKSKSGTSRSLSHPLGASQKSNQRVKKIVNDTVRKSSIEVSNHHSSQIDNFGDHLGNAMPPSRHSSKNINVTSDILISPDNKDVVMDTISEGCWDGDFATVKNKKQKRNCDGETKAGLHNKPKCSDIYTGNSNKFSVLGELEIECDSLNTNNIENIDVNASKTPRAEKKLSAKNSFCPPIFLRNVNVKSLIDQLKAKNVIFKFQNKSKFKSKLFLQDASTHAEMMELLRKNNVDSYSYTPSEFKRESIVCRGLYHKTGVDEIKNDIETLVPDSVDTVSKFTTEYSRKNGFETGLFLITLKQNRNLSEIACIKFILNQVVSWEKPKSNLKVPQCWRCQLWGHYSKNCNRPFACVKCDKKHPPGECDFVAMDGVKPFCVNCGKSGHPSNYRGCPAYTSFIAIRNKQSEESKARKKSAAENVRKELFSSRLISSDATFASLFEGGNLVADQKKPANLTLIEEFRKIARELCGPEPVSLEDRIVNFVRNYKKMPKDQAKADCLTLLKDVNSFYGP